MNTTQRRRSGARGRTRRGSVGCDPRGRAAVARRRPGASGVLRRLAHWTVLPLLALPALAAQERTLRLAPESHTPPDRMVHVTATPYEPTSRPGGQGWVHVVVRNHHEDAHELVLVLRDDATPGRRLSVTTRLELPPAPRSTPVEPLVVDLPFPCLREPTSLHVALDGRISGHMTGLIGNAARGFASLLVGARPGVAAGWAGFLWKARSGSPGSTVATATVGTTQECPPDDLPRDWTTLTGYDVIVVDGRHALLDAALQRVLLTLAESGGRIVVRDPGALPAGDLRERLAEHIGRPVPTGLGELLAVDAGTRFESEAEAALVGDFLFDGVTGRASEPTVSGFLQRRHYAPAEVPGVSGVPPNLFFMIVFLFVLFVGPINHVWLRRRGRPWLVLVTVPAGGLAITALIVTWSLATEGLSLRGVVRSVTWLDQERHRAVSWSTRTLFAGVSPTELAPDPGTLLVPGAAWLRDPAGAATGLAYAADLERGTLDGRLLPSRRPAPLVAVTHATTRERVRFHAVGAEFDIVDGGGLRVVDGDGTLVLHDFDGRWFVARPGKRLAEVGARDAERAAAALFAAFDRYAPGSLAAAPPDPAERPLWPRLRHGIAPGTWVGRVAEDPALDDLALETEWMERHHVVVAQLAPEDIVK